MYFEFLFFSFGDCFFPPLILLLDLYEGGSKRPD